MDERILCIMDSVNSKQNSDMDVWISVFAILNPVPTIGFPMNNVNLFIVSLLLKYTYEYYTDIVIEFE